MGGWGFLPFLFFIFSFLHTFPLHLCLCCFISPLPAPPHLNSLHIITLSESHLKEPPHFLPRPYLQGLQVALLWIAEQRGDAVVVPHAADVGVPPQREDLTDDGHPAQGAVNQLHDVRVAHLLQTERGGQEDTTGAKLLVPSKRMK